jgi:hypothetical protein
VIEPSILRVGTNEQLDLISHFRIKTADTNASSKGIQLNPFSFILVVSVSIGDIHLSLQMEMMILNLCKISWIQCLIGTSLDDERIKLFIFGQSHFVKLFNLLAEYYDTSQL